MGTRNPDGSNEHRYKLSGCVLSTKAHTFWMQACFDYKHQFLILRTQAAKQNVTTFAVLMNQFANSCVLYLAFLKDWDLHESRTTANIWSSNLESFSQYYIQVAQETPVITRKSTTVQFFQPNKVQTLGNKVALLCSEKYSIKAMLMSSRNPEISV